MQDVTAEEEVDNARPLQVQSAHGRLHHLTLGSADWQDLLQNSSVGASPLYLRSALTELWLQSCR